MTRTPPLRWLPLWLLVVAVLIGLVWLPWGTSTAAGSEGSDPSEAPLGDMSFAPETEGEETGHRDGDGQERVDFEPAPLPPKQDADELSQEESKVWIGLVDRRNRPVFQSEVWLDGRIQGLTDREGRFPFPSSAIQGDRVHSLTFRAPDFLIETYRWQGEERWFTLRPGRTAHWQVQWQDQLDQEDEKPLGDLMLELRLAAGGADGHLFWSGRTDQEGRATMPALSQSTSVLITVGSQSGVLYRGRSPMIRLSHGGPDWEPAYQAQFPIVLPNTQGDREFDLQVFDPEGRPLAGGFLFGEGPFEDRHHFPFDPQGQASITAFLQGEVQIYDRQHRCLWRGAVPRDLPDRTWILRLQEGSVSGFLRTPAGESPQDYVVTLATGYVWPGSREFKDLESLPLQHPGPQAWVSPGEDGAFHLPWILDSDGDLDGELLVRHQTSGLLVQQASLEDWSGEVLVPGMCQIDLTISDSIWQRGWLFFFAAGPIRSYSKPKAVFPLQNGHLQAWLPRGEYQLQWRASAKSHGLDLGRHEFLSASTKKKLTFPEGRYFAGKVRVDGMPFSGAKLVAIHPDGKHGKISAQAWSDAEGSYRLGPVPEAESYEIHLSLRDVPGYWMPSRDMIMIQTRANEAEVDFEVQTGQLRLELNPDTADRLQFLELWNLDSGRSAGQRSWQEISLLGNFRLPPGRYRIQGKGQGLRIPPLDFSISAAEINHLKLVSEPVGSLLLSQAGMPKGLSYGWYQAEIEWIPGASVPSTVSRKPFVRRHQIANEFFLHPGLWTVVIRFPKKDREFLWRGEVELRPGQSLFLKWDWQDEDLVVVDRRYASFSSWP
ncbi:MAG: hypothetical protein DWQ01_11270 [Planctomycetota bacterium]|nr:MAG: hypothetical protein DWQ01_11270 [Planctomycetota bacterium]